MEGKNYAMTETDVSRTRASLEHACWSASRVSLTLTELRNYENQVKRQGGVLICGYC